MLEGKSAARARQVSTWLSQLYTPPAGAQWGAVEPDRLGEHLVIGALALGPDVLPKIVAAAGTGQLQRAATVLGRALANDTIPVEERQRVAVALTTTCGNPTSGIGLARAAIRVAGALANPEPLLACLSAAIADLPATAAEELLDVVPLQPGVLAGLGVQVASRV